MLPPELGKLLSPSFFRELIYQEDSLCYISSRSKVHPTDFPPKIVTREMGELIQQVDKRAELLTVFLYPTHAEIWLTREWKMSNSYLLRKREESAIDRLQSNQADDIFRLLVDRWHLPKNEDTEKIARKLASCHDEEVYKNFGISDLYQKFKEEKLELSNTQEERII